MATAERAFTVSRISSKPPKLKRNQVIRQAGSILLMVENDHTPSDEEWNEFLALLVTHRAELPTFRLLVVTTGGGPNTAQRKRLEQTLGGIRMRVAVISDSMKVRFIASTIMLFHRDHRAFSTSELSEAYEYLGLSPTDRRRVEVAIREMEQMVR